jgi:hypothetical protein
MRTALLKLLEAGHSRNDAYESLGICDEVLRGETARDQEFGREVRRAEAAGKMALIEIVLAGAKKDPKHAEWMLERKWWQDFARRDPKNISPEVFTSVLARVVSILLPRIPEAERPAARGDLDRIMAEAMAAK